MKKTKRHVGRPTNEEVKKIRNKKLFISLTVVIIFILCLTTVLFINKQNSIDKVKGKSSSTPTVNKLYVSSTSRYTMKSNGGRKDELGAVNISYSTSNTSYTANYVLPSGTKNWQFLGYSNSNNNNGACYIRSSKTSFKLKCLGLGEVSAIKIVPYDSNYKAGKEKIIEWVYVPVRAPKIVSVTKKTNTSVSVNFQYANDDSLGDKFVLEYSTSSNFSGAKKVTYSSAKSAGKTYGSEIKGLTKGKKYYFRAYITKYNYNTYFPLSNYKKANATTYSSYSNTKNISL